MTSYHRHILNNSDTLTELEPIRPFVHLVESLNILVSDHPPSAAVNGAARGLLSGPTSVAYLFLWLAKLYTNDNSSSKTNSDNGGGSGSDSLNAGGEDVPSSSSSTTTITSPPPRGILRIDDRSPRDWCLAYLRAAHSNHARHPRTGRAGGIQDEALAYACIKAAATGGDAAYVERAVRLAWDQVPRRVQEDGDDGDKYNDKSSGKPSPSLAPDINGWLYGRAGTLYLLRLLTHWVPSSTAAVAPVVQALTQHILANDAPWSWKGKQYIGAAHGDAGILAQLLLSRPELAQRLEPRVRGLLREQLPSGQWDSSRRSSSNTGTPGHARDELVQFCHGAPGMVIALEAMRPALVGAQAANSGSGGGGGGDEEATSPSPLIAAVDTAIDRARDVVWERGLLTKEPNLCHGISGNALAFAGSDARRELLLRMATPRAVAAGVVSDAVFTPGSDAYGLLWGEAGRAWVWAVLDGRAQGFVGFSDV